MSELMLSDQLIGEIVTHLMPSYPEEGCGLVFRDAQGGLRVHGTKNIANDLHEEDPETFPRTARTFYAIEPKEFLLADKRGDEIPVVFHSHCDCGDYFSDEDRMVATMGMGEDAGPAWPGRDYLVVSIVDNIPKQATLYRYDDDTLRFEGVEVYKDLERFAQA